MAYNDVLVSGVLLVFLTFFFLTLKMHLSRTVIYLFIFKRPNLWYMEVAEQGVELKQLLRPIPQPQQHGTRASSAASNTGSLTY